LPSVETSEKDFVLVSFTGMKRILYFAGHIESINNTTDEREGKFLKRKRKDPTTEDQRSFSSLLASALF